jgi:hypothetical protein
MYATGTRVSQALRLKGIDVLADPITGAHSIRLPKAKRGHSRSYRVIQSADPVRDLSPIVDLARQREVPSYSEASPVITCTWSSRSTRGWQAFMRKWFIATLFGTPRRCAFWEKMQRPGAITGYLCHTSSVYQYLRENDCHARRRCDGRRVDSLIVSQKLIVLHDEQIGYLDLGKNCRVVFVTPTFWQSERGYSNTANTLPTWTVSYWIQRRNFFLRHAGAVLRLWY